MRSYVLADAGLAKRAGQFAWLEVNAERDANAAFLEKFPVEAYPTLFVLDPKGEKVLVKWAGAASAEGVAGLLDDGLRAAGGATGADALLAEGDRALGERRFEDAVGAYRRALAAGGRPWPRRGRAADALVGLLSTQSAEDCAREGRRLLQTLTADASAASVAATALGCASEVKASWMAGRRRELEAITRELLGAPGLHADLVSGMREALVDARRADGDAAGARREAEAWWKFLAAERERAPDARARSAFDAATVSAAKALGDPARALPLVRRSEQELPGDYDPPYWVAVAAREAGRDDEALAALERALKLGYGARKLRMFAAKAALLEKRGDSAAVRSTVDAALQHANQLPPQQLRRREKAIVKELEAKRAALKGS
jgi:tetratricopeptide (TPR) repeat protein